VSYSDTLDVRLTDSALRDGSHAKAHRFTVEDVRRVVAALDGAGVPVLEVSHGDGLGGSSFNYGFSLVDERELIAAAVETATRRASRRCSCRGSARARTSAPRATWASPSCASRRTAPKPTSRSSTSGWRASWDSRRSGSS
jgi:isopropylmalate/homocitrate/citramalate synthase